MFPKTFSTRTTRRSRTGSPSMITPPTSPTRTNIIMSTKEEGRMVEITDLNHTSRFDNLINYQYIPRYDSSQVSETTITGS